MVAMTRGHEPASGSRRRIIVPDLNGQIVEATAPLEDLLLTLAAPIDEPNDPLSQVDLTAEDETTLEILSAGARALGLIRRLLLRSPALVLRARDGERRDPLRLVSIPTGQVDDLGAAARVLATGLRPGGPVIVDVGLRAAADHLHSTPRVLVDLTIRTHRLCDQPRDADHELVVASLHRAQPCGAPVTLSDVENAACRRLQARLAAIWQRPAH